MSSDKQSTNIPGASEDLLAELREKTAQLAKSIQGDDGPSERHLDIEKGEEKKKDDTEDLSIKQTPQLKELQQAPSAKSSRNAAAELVRKKISKYYKNEPDAAEELIEAQAAGKQRSKHQQFMYELSTSGKSLAEVQTEWHNYYVDLPDSEKHVVWQEFYQMQSAASAYAKQQQTKKPKPTAPQAAAAISTTPPPTDNRSASDIKSQLLDKVSAGGKLKPIHHVKSLLFGIGMASVVGLIIMFVFFNEVFIAPFISPSQNVSATPIIGPASSENVGPESKIIIPKINVEVPVVFDLNSIEEADIQKALEDGVVHYATTPNPGEIGNSVIVGHSSNNFLNAGKYKFAFVLLKRLENEDLFYVQRDGVRYTYKVYKKEIVPPTAVEVLDTQERANTITLITCDPPGTSINRLIIVAEQIDPDPAKNTESTAPEPTEVRGGENEELPSNAPSLWSRLWPF